MDKVQYHQQDTAMWTDAAALQLDSLAFMMVSQAMLSLIVPCHYLDHSSDDRSGDRHNKRYHQISRLMLEIATGEKPVFRIAAFSVEF